MLTEFKHFWNKAKRFFELSPLYVITERYAIARHPNGCKALQVFTKGDHREDTFWYENGEVEMYHTYERNVRCGMWCSYYDNGNLKFLKTYKDGTAEGLAESYYPNGNTQHRSAYLNGDLDGLCTRWYDTGEKEHEFTLVNGEKHGVHTEWDIEGNVTSSENFKKGKKCQN